VDSDDEKPFPLTTEWFEAFFRPENYTNVRGLIVFGY